MNFTRVLPAELVLFFYSIRLESMKELLDKFAEIDSNRDGLVDLNEFAEYLNLPVTRHIRHLFSLYDRVSSLCKICHSN